MVIDLSDNKYENDIMILERFSREILARQGILAFMIDSGMNKSENFNQYHNELIDYQGAYDYAKKEFYEKALKPLIKDNEYNSWSLDFENREVTFYE